MTLKNLLKTGQLKDHPADGAEIRRLLDAARRNLGDARVQKISPETRFDAAYKAIMQAALAALMVQQGVVHRRPSDCWAMWQRGWRKTIPNS